MDVKETVLSSFFVCKVTASGKAKWDIYNRPTAFGFDGESINILFEMNTSAKARHATIWLMNLLENNQLDWLNFKYDKWQFDLDLFYNFFNVKKVHSWARGIVEPIFEINQEERNAFNKNTNITIVTFIITPNEVTQSMSKKIFLSHKGIDKPIVRDFFETLKTIGFIPWLDEDAMFAGVTLDRALYKGMQESCAAVFFITPEYKDENYLATEIDYAIEEKRNKGDRFSIITLVFKGSDGKKGSVPGLLRRFAWKEPVNNLIALQEIIKALPVQPTSITWKN